MLPQDFGKTYYYQRVPATHKSSGMDAEYDLSNINPERMKFEPGQEIDMTFLTPETILGGHDITCPSSQPSACGYTAVEVTDGQDVLTQFPWVLEHTEAFSPPCPVPQQVDTPSYTHQAPQSSPYPLQPSPYPAQTSPYPPQTPPYHSQASPYSTCGTLHSPYPAQTFFPTTPHSIASPPPPAHDPTKEEIRKRLLMKRQERGQPEIKVEYRLPEPEKLTQRDMERRRMRRERNKKAAHKCREKKRGEQEKVKQVAGVLERENVELKRTVKELQDWKENFEHVLHKHLKDAKACKCGARSSS